MPYAEQRLITDDGHPVVARLFAPGDAPRGAVLIVPAFGVAQTYYADLADWLARRGFAALTFDYRGTGLSRQGSLRGFHADVIEDWAGRDCAAALEFLRAQAPQVPLTWLGHSLGGQIVPFVPNHAELARIITIATGSGYWRENSPRLKRVVWWLWYVIVPVTLPLFDYFPGRRLRKVGDLPRRVMEQWRRWCLHPEYLAGVEGEWARQKYAAVRTPMLSLSFTDDDYMSARNTESIHSFYVNAPKSFRRISPDDAGVKHIGHFGFFRAKFENALWERYLLPELPAA